MRKVAEGARPLEASKLQFLRPRLRRASGRATMRCPAPMRVRRKRPFYDPKPKYCPARGSDAGLLFATQTVAKSKDILVCQADSVHD